MTVTLSAEQATIENQIRPFSSGTHFVLPIPVNGSHPMYLKAVTPKPMLSWISVLPPLTKAVILCQADKKLLFSIITFVLFIFQQAHCRSSNAQSCAGKAQPLFRSSL